jgi:hypothetical protein
MMMNISSFGPVGCGRLLRGASLQLCGTASPIICFFGQFLNVIWRRILVFLLIISYVVHIQHNCLHLIDLSYSIRTNVRTFPYCAIGCCCNAILNTLLSSQRSSRSGQNRQQHIAVDACNNYRAQSFTPHDDRAVYTQRRLLASVRARHGIQGKDSLCPVHVVIIPWQ